MAGTSNPSTLTIVETLRAKLNDPALGKGADANLLAPLGDLLSVLLTASPGGGSVPEPTVGAAISGTASASAVSQTSSTVATAAAASQTSSYVQTDVQTIATLANALKAAVNLIVTDIAAILVQLNRLAVDSAGSGGLVARVNQLRTDDLAMNESAVSGATESGVTVASNACQLAQSPTPNGLFQVVGYGTVAGVKQLVTSPAQALVSGQVYWDGGVNLTFFAGDAIASCDVTYAKGDLSQQVSALLQTVSP